MLHSILSPSSAARRVACPGSRALEAKFPQEDSIHAREGRAAHWVASEIFYGRDVQVNQLTPDNEVITQEMIDGAILYRDVLKDCVLAAPIEQFHIEETIEIKAIHPQCFGTPDAWFFDELKQVLYIFDYKFGHGYVEVFENWQLIEYGAGIIAKITKEIKQIVFTIVQPRCYQAASPVRNWKCNWAEFVKYVARLQLSEQLAMTEGAPYRPSSACTYCKARHVCPALQDSTANIADIVKKMEHKELEPKILGKELKYLKQAEELLSARITGLEAQAVSEIKKGNTVTHWRLKETPGRECWKNAHDEIAVLGELFGVNVKKEELITPKQAVKAGIPESIVKNYSEVKQGYIKLVPLEAHKIFKN